MILVMISIPSSQKVYLKKKKLNHLHMLLIYIRHNNNNNNRLFNYSIKIVANLLIK